MSASHCDRASEVLADIASGQWPDAAPHGLRAHVESCLSCAELALVAGALLSDRLANEPIVALPPSGAVWFRMQARAKRDAATVAARTVGRVQAIVMMVTVAGLAIAFALSSVPEMAGAWFISALPDVDLFRATAGALPSAVIGLAVGAALLVLIPVALYLALVEE
ncbi:MAG: hypothetical protein ACYC7A_21500 [Thermoanaerobaculia bacterium]